MRKLGRIAGSAAVLLALLTLLSCGGGYTCTDLLAAGREACGEEPELRVYFDGGTDFNRLDTRRAAQLYDGMDPVPLCDGYAVCLSPRDRVYEIHIYRCSATDRTGELEKILRRRIELLQSPDVYLYDPEGYEEIVNAAAVYRKGKYVCLLATPDNDGVWDAIREKI